MNFYKLLFNMLAPDLLFHTFTTLYPFYRSTTITFGGAPLYDPNNGEYSSFLIWWYACACMQGITRHMVRCATQCNISCAQLSSPQKHSKHSQQITLSITQFSQQVFRTLYFSWTKCLVDITLTWGHNKDSPNKQHEPHSAWQGQQHASMPQ